jgi:hypothetical protein
MAAKAMPNPRILKIPDSTSLSLKKIPPKSKLPKKQV